MPNSKALFRLSVVLATVWAMATPLSVVAQPTVGEQQSVPGLAVPHAVMTRLMQVDGRTSADFERSCLNGEAAVSLSVLRNFDAPASDGALSAPQAEYLLAYNTSDTEFEPKTVLKRFVETAPTLTDQVGTTELAGLFPEMAWHCPAPGAPASFAAVGHQLGHFFHSHADGISAMNFGNNGAAAEAFFAKLSASISSIRLADHVSYREGAAATSTWVQRSRAWMTDAGDVTATLSQMQTRWQVSVALPAAPDLR